MLVTIMKSKIHKAKVTASELDYEGSITIDSELIKKAHLLIGEKVLVANLVNGLRIETYVIEGPPGSGTICINGAAAHRFSIGDRVIIMSFAHMTLEEAQTFKPTRIKVDNNNKIIS